MKQNESEKTERGYKQMEFKEVIVLDLVTFEAAQYMVGDKKKYLSK